MHLTNYSVNKHNENFGRDEKEDRGSKRSIRWFTEFLRANDHDVAKFWNDIAVSRSLLKAKLHFEYKINSCSRAVPHQLI